MFKKIHEQYLISKIKQGDKEAFSEIYHTYLDKIYRFVYFKISSKEETEDIVSEAFFKIFNHLVKSENKIDNLQAFIYQTTRNLISDHYRKNYSTVPLEKLENFLPDNANHHLINDDLRTVEKALSSLKDEYREIIILCYLDQLSAKEAAQILQKPAGTVRVTLHRALKALREKLEEK